MKQLEHRATALPFVYLLACRDGSLYAGAAKDLAKRLAEHRAGRASRYTRSRLPVEIVWSREVETWSAALSEEARIKRLGRAAKLALLAPGRRRIVGRRSSFHKAPDAPPAR